MSWQCSTQGSVEGILPTSRMALGLISASVMEGRARISGCKPHGFTSKNILLLALLYENHLFFFFCSNQVYGSAFSQVADLLTDRMCCIVSQAHFNMVTIRFCNKFVYWPTERLLFQNFPSETARTICVFHSSCCKLLVCIPMSYIS